MAKTRNLLDNINASNNNKKSHVGRNAAIIAGAVGLAGAGTAGAAIYNHYNSDEVAPEVDDNVDVDYDETEMQEVEANVEDESTAYTGFHGSAAKEEVDPVVEDVNEVGLNIDEEDPFEAIEIDDVLASELTESQEIEFIGDDDDFVTEIFDVEDDSLMIIEEDFDDIDVDLNEDFDYSTVEDTDNTDFDYSSVDESTDFDYSALD